MLLWGTRLHRKHFTQSYTSNNNQSFPSHPFIPIVPTTSLVTCDMPTKHKDHCILLILSSVCLIYSDIKLSRLIQHRPFNKYKTNPIPSQYQHTKTFQTSTERCPKPLKLNVNSNMSASCTMQQIIERYDL